MTATRSDLRIVVAITGASGAVYGIRLLEALARLGVESADPDTCPPCRSTTPEPLPPPVETQSISPVPGVWTVYSCTTCRYTWRSTEPAANTDPEHYPAAFRLAPGQLPDLPVGRSSRRAVTAETTAEPRCPGVGDRSRPGRRAARVAAWALVVVAVGCGGYAESAGARPSRAERGLSDSPVRGRQSRVWARHRAARGPGRSSSAEPRNGRRWTAPSTTPGPDTPGWW